MRFTLFGEKGDTMKVTLPKDYRQYFTLDDLDRAKAVIASFKEDTTTLKELAESAVSEALRGEKYGWCEEVLKVEAHVGKNNRIPLDYFTDGSLNFDVYIDFTAQWGGVCGGYIKGTASVYDIWNAPTEYRQHMYYRIFKEVK